MKRLGLTLVAAALVWIGTGLFFVGPDEVAVVRRFGAMLPELRGPGAHVGLPWGLDRVDRLKLREVRRVTVGPTNLAGSPTGAAGAPYLTGDRNLVDVEASLQYTIRDPGRYLFAAEDPQAAIARAGQAAISHVLSGAGVDRALTLGKQELAAGVAGRLQESADRLGLGVSIRSVDLGTVRPPAEVAEAFDDVIAALRQREGDINRAHSYANRTLAEARASAQRLRDTAQGHRDRVLREAEGEAARFERLLAEYVRAPELTGRRLYLQTLAETLPRFRSKVIVGGEDLDLSILPEEK